MTWDRRERRRRSLAMLLCDNWLEGETGGIQEAEMNKGQSSLSPAPHLATPDCSLMGPGPESYLGLLVRDSATLKLGVCALLLKAQCLPVRGLLACVPPGAAPLLLLPGNDISHSALWIPEESRAHPLLSVLPKNWVFWRRQGESPESQEPLPQAALQIPEAHRALLSYAPV